MCRFLIIQPAAEEHLYESEVKVAAQINTNESHLCDGLLRSDTALQRFAPQCGKHLLKGFQVQFAWNSLLINLLVVWHHITTTQVENFSHPKSKSKCCAHNRGMPYPVFHVHTGNFLVFISADYLVTAVLSVDYALRVDLAWRLFKTI